MLVYRIFFVKGSIPSPVTKRSSANMKKACIDDGDVDGGDNVKVEYDGVYERVNIRSRLLLLLLMLMMLMLTMLEVV